MVNCAKCGKLNLRKLGEPQRQNIPSGIYFGGALRSSIQQSIQDNAVQCKNCGRIFCIECVRPMNGRCASCGAEGKFDSLWA